MTLIRRPDGFVTIDVTDATGSAALGHELARFLFPGAVIALVGPLGAGKTYLVRAIAEALGVRDSRLVSSPTFVLIQEYTARLPIYHFDAYRLRSPEEFCDLGAHEYFEGSGVCLVEWADRVERCLPPEHLRISISCTGETSRRYDLEARGERYASILRAIMAAAIPHQPAT
jgi:tRNA threonylcarbamoyladenosine biosynthesis protein TsaE